MQHKYDPLNEFLILAPAFQKEVLLSFEQLELIINANLPPSAFKHSAWWSNAVDGVHVSAHAWEEAGWKVEHADRDHHWVRFIRQ